MRTLTEAELLNIRVDLQKHAIQPDADGWYTLNPNTEGSAMNERTGAPRLVLSAVCRDGDVITAFRHAECIHMAIRKGWLPPVRSTEQGFVDDNGVYYSRKDAVKVAIASGQIPASFKKHTLTSEDLW